MSSSDIKFESILRNFKNKAKINLEQKKIIINFSYDISSNMIIDTSDLFCNKIANKFIYDFDYDLDFDRDFDNEFDNKFATGKKDTDTNINIDILNYISQNGYLYDVYNAELCNEDWLIYMFLFKNIHYNFISSARNIDSLHFIKLSNEIDNSYQFAGLSAIHHFLNSSNVLNTWNWISTITPTNKILRNKYKHNYISMLGSNIPTIDNITSIINNVADRLMKINFMTNDILGNIEMYIIYACLSIKLLDSIGILFTRFYNPNEWSSQHINILRLYALIFQKVYVYNFNIVEPRTYILCKNKKKIPNVKIYKELIYLCTCSKDALPTHNLFTKSSFDDQWLEKISGIFLDIKSNNLAIIDNKELIDFTIDGLKQNTAPFI
jgi:hypothetical protein